MIILDSKVSIIPKGCFDRTMKLLFSDMKGTPKEMYQSRPNIKLLNLK